MRQKSSRCPWALKTDEASAFISINYYNQDEVKSSDRGAAGFPVPNTGVTRGSSGTPQARIDFTDPNTGNAIDCTLNDGVLNDGLNNIPFYDPADPCGAGDDFHPFSDDDRFNFASYNLVVTPSERWNIFGKVSRDITDNVSAHMRGSFSRRESNNTVAPEPIFIAAGAGTGALPDTVGGRCDESLQSVRIYDRCHQRSQLLYRSATGRIHASKL